MKTKFKQTEIGEIPEGWVAMSFGEMAVLHYGKGLPEKHRDIKGKIPVYGSSGITGFHNMPLVNESGYIIGRKGTIGVIHKSEVPFFPIDTVYYTTKNDVKCDFDYFYYLVQSLKLTELNSDSAVPGLNRETAYAQPIVVPKSRQEQGVLASILSSLDDKIELNRKMNKTLEDMAKALFKYWFVDFEFPNEEGKPYKSSGGEMVESELGPIPKGWETPKFSQLINYLEGPGIRNWQYSTTGTRFINIRLINNGNIDVSSASLINQKDVDEKYQHFLLKENDMVVSTSGTLGKSAIVRKNHLPLLLNTSVIRFRPVSLENYPYMYQYLQSRYFLDEQIRLASGSVQANFGPTHLNQMFVVSPSQIILSMFNNACKEIYEEILINMDENDILIGIRDSLLPKLMSGKIRTL